MLVKVNHTIFPQILNHFKLVVFEQLPQEILQSFRLGYCFNKSGALTYSLFSIMQLGFLANAPHAIISPMCLCCPNNNHLLIWLDDLSPKSYSTRSNKTTFLYPVKGITHHLFWTTIDVFADLHCASNFGMHSSILLVISAFNAIFFFH